MNLTKKHRLFIEAYAGDILEAMRVAGFEGADSYLNQEGRILLGNPVIREALNQRSKYTTSLIKTVATRDERQAFWTSIMRNQDPNAQPLLNDKGVAKVPEDLPLPMRLKASELLGKSETDFIERMDVHHNLSISDVIKEAYTIPMEDLNAIEVEYERQYKAKNNTLEGVVVSTDEVDESLSGDVSESSLGDFI